MLIGAATSEAARPTNRITLRDAPTATGQTSASVAAINGVAQIMVARKCAESAGNPASFQEPADKGSVAITIHVSAADKRNRHGDRDFAQSNAKGVKITAQAAQLPRQYSTSELISAGSRTIM